MNLVERVFRMAENPFAQYYGMLMHQQNMLQDAVRTGTYQRAISENSIDFKDKVVLDVGAGTGILAYFAVQAGATRAYAVELSDMAENAKVIMEDNQLSDRVIVIKGKIEDIELPEEVDIIVSEPMGFFLVHERMLECYVCARKRFLKPGGKMFPTIGTMMMAPFTDNSIYQEQMEKVQFWQQNDFYGLKLSSMAKSANKNHFSQPVVGYFPSSMLISMEVVQHTLDFTTLSQDQLEAFTIPLHFTIHQTAILHGLGCWFTVDFKGSTSTVVLSTGPDAPGTHWYQCRLLLSTPIAVNASQTISGHLQFNVNSKYSYDIQLQIQLDGTQVVSSNTIHLQDQMYHYLYHPGVQH